MATAITLPQHPDSLHPDGVLSMSSDQFRAFLAVFLVAALATCLTLTAWLGRYTIGNNMIVFDHWTGEACAPPLESAQAECFKAH